MSFCTQCGSPLMANAKFCPACGTKILTSGTKDVWTGYKQKMYKNVVQSLENEGKKFVQKKAQEVFQKVLSNGSSVKSTATETVSEIFKSQNQSVAKEFYQPEETVQTGAGVDIWTWIYVLLNGILIYKGYRSGEVIGVVFFSLLILLVVFWRRDKPKPYNWLVKIIQLLQMVFLVALIAERIEYPNVITLLMAALFLVNLRLVFKGNKT